MAMSTTTSSIRCKTGLKLNHNRTGSNHNTEHGKCLKPRRVLCTLYLYDRAYGIPVSKCNLAPSLTWLASKDTLDQLCSGSIVGLGWLSIHIVYLYIHENEVFYHDYDVVSFQKANYTSFTFYRCVLWRKYIFIYETSLRIRQSFVTCFVIVTMLIFNTGILPCRKWLFIRNNEWFALCFYMFVQLCCYTRA